MIAINWLGCVDYAIAWEQQKSLVATLSHTTDHLGQLLLLEHPPTYTLGRNGHSENLLLDETSLKVRGIAFYHVDRGGDITYHGPGQLVGYPILNLKMLYPGYGLGIVRRYVSDLEEMLIQTLRAFGLNGQRHEHHRGVWLETQSGLAKIAAIGVRISAGGISSHGFALNVAPDLRYFTGIIPCGIQELGVTSMTAMLGHPLTISDVLPTLTTAFSQVFNINAPLTPKGTKAP